VSIIRPRPGLLLEETANAVHAGQEFLRRAGGRPEHVHIDEEQGRALRETYPRGLVLTQRLWVDGPLPGMNEMVDAAKGAGGVGRHYARLKAAWTLKVKAEARRQRILPVARACLTFEWAEANRRRDPDNVAAAKKLVLDGLVAAGVLPKDGWKAVAGFRDIWAVSARPGVLVVIEEVPA
jgi:hypothetical protein